MQELICAVRPLESELLSNRARQKLRALFLENSNRLSRARPLMAAAPRENDSDNNARHAEYELGAHQ